MSFVAAVLGLGGAACAPQQAAPTPTMIPPVVEACPACPESAADQLPYEDLWSSSAHADAEAVAFTFWNEEIPPQIPVECAGCHSTSGHLDLLGLDGSVPGSVDVSAAVGDVITCAACHNDSAASADRAVMPSGAEIAGLGLERRCISCHQGRAAGPTVDEATAAASLPDLDTASDALEFVNVHYGAAAATQYGGLAGGGYQYQGSSYDSLFAHVEGYDTCISCHDSHTLEIRLETCADCHPDVENADDLRDIRMEGSQIDYDGDGNIDEGIYYEIAGLQEALYQAIGAYSRIPIVYDGSVYPFFFLDTDIDGAPSEEEAVYPNKYNAWTPRLLRAAYNYHASLADPGAFVHGPKYILQLLYDSIQDLDAERVVGLARVDPGHFAGSQEAFRHWDGEEAVPAGCARCHSATGLPTYLADGANVSAPLSNGFLCSTCHYETVVATDDVTNTALYTVTQVAFPSGAVLDAGDSGNNLCLVCHQGRQAGSNVDDLLSGLSADRVYPDLQFRSVNVHYFAAGATLFGSEAGGAYQYARRSYIGRYEREEIPEEGIGCNTCVQCHAPHSLQVDLLACQRCHPDVEDAGQVRVSTRDYDGDGDVEEGVAGEIETLHDALYRAIQSYATRVARVGIVYDAQVYPYFFVDADGDGETDPDESVSANQYNAWTPRLLRAAYNYQFVTKDPGVFAHNSIYTIQILYDSLSDIGGRQPRMVRP